MEWDSFEWQGTLSFGDKYSSADLNEVEIFHRRLQDCPDTKGSRSFAKNLTCVRRYLDALNVQSTPRTPNAETAWPAFDSYVACCSDMLAVDPKRRKSADQVVQRLGPPEPRTQTEHRRQYVTDNASRTISAPRVMKRPRLNYDRDAFQTRNLGACIRCRMQRIRVSPIEV